MPDEKEVRENVLRDPMKDIIKQSIAEILSSQTMTDNESPVVKLVIEFCLALNETYFLFHGIYDLFADYNA